MTTCASCGKEMRDDDWTCGACGAPAGGAATPAGAGPSGYAPSYAPQADAYGPADTYTAPVAYGAPPAPAAAKGGMSRSTLMIIIVAALAIIAIVAVWFVFIRGTGGSSPFLGTWTPPAGNDASVTIKLRSGEFTVTMVGTDVSGAEEKYTIPAHLAGANLEITVEDFIEANGDEGQAAQAKAAFETIIKDFRIVFTVKDATHLEMKVEGTPVAGAAAGQASIPAVVLVKSE